MSAFTLTEREIARRLAYLHEGVELWGLRRLDALAREDQPEHDRAFRCQQQFLEQAQPLRRMLADVRGRR